MLLRTVNKIGTDNIACNKLKLETDHHEQFIHNGAIYRHYKL